LLAALGLMPLVARSLAQISLIPLGVPAMLAIFILILRRSGFGFSVAFSDVATTLGAVPNEVVSENQVAAENTATRDAAINPATTSPR
jgi:hypothetical protein